MARRRSSLAPSFRARAMAWLARRFGPSFVLPTIAAAEARDIDAYDDQPEAVAGGLPTDERSHARIIEAAASTGRRAGRHRRSPRSRAAIAVAAATRCAPRCWAPTTAWSRTSAW